MARTTLLVSMALTVSLATGCKKADGEKKAAPPASDKPTSGEEASMPAVGSPAPDFEAEAHDGTKISLAGLRGSPVVLYFYPKDETSGCTAEAEAFRDESAELAKVGAKVIGVSVDSLESHREFAEKHDLPFPLLADTDKSIAAKYGVSTARGVTERVTFVIDRDGKIAQVFPKVKVDGHSGEVIAAIKATR